MRTLRPMVQPNCCSPCASAARRIWASGSSAASGMSTPRRRIRSPSWARTASGHAAAAPPSSLMKSRLFTAQYLPCFRRTLAHLTTGETPALRDCDPVYNWFGSNRQCSGRGQDFRFRPNPTAAPLSSRPSHCVWRPRDLPQRPFPPLKPAVWRWRQDHIHCCGLRGDKKPAQSRPRIMIAQAEYAKIVNIKRAILVSPERPAHRSQL
jgi:hypothetical protein